MVGEVKNPTGPKGKGVAHKTSTGLKIASETGDVYPIAKEDIPEYLDVIYEKPIFFRLTPDEMGLKGIGPWEGSHLMRFASFVPTDDDGVPEPRLKKGGPFKWVDAKGKTRKGFARDKLQFTAMCEIVSGDYEGLQVGWFLDYIFTPREGNEVGWIGSTKSVTTLESFLKAAGCDFAVDSVPYDPENVLPNLQAFLVEKDAIFQGYIEEGKLASLSTLAPGLVPTKIKPRTEKVTQDEDEE